MSLPAGITTCKYTSWGGLLHGRLLCAWRAGGVGLLALAHIRSREKGESGGGICRASQPAKPTT